MADRAERFAVSTTSLRTFADRGRPPPMLRTERDLFPGRFLFNVADDVENQSEGLREEHASFGPGIDRHFGRWPRCRIVGGQGCKANRRAGSSERECCWPTGTSHPFFRWDGPCARTIRPFSAVSSGRWSTMRWRRSMIGRGPARSRRSPPRRRCLAQRVRSTTGELCDGPHSAICLSMLRVGVPMDVCEKKLITIIPWKSR